MKKLLIGLVLIIVVVGGVGYFYIGSILKSGIEVAGSRVLGTSITVDTVAVSPLSGSGNIGDFRIANPEGYDADYAIELGELDLQMDLASVLSDVIVIDSLLVRAPVITYETKITSDNIRALMANLPEGQEPPVTDATSAESSKQIVIRDLQIISPRVDVVSAFASESLVIPDIMIQNIGEEGGAVSIAQAARRILQELSRSVLQAELPSLEDLEDRAREEIDSRVEEVQDQLQEEVDGVRDQLEDQVEDVTDRLRNILPQ